MLVNVNNWLSSNQILVFSLLVPIISGLVALLSSWFAIRRGLASARVHRNYESTALLSGFRQDWINALRNDLAEHQAICLASKINATKNGLPDDRRYRLAELANRVLLRVNPSDPDYDALSTALAVERLSITREGVENPETINIAQKILKREWERLKSDLKSDALSS